MVNKRTEIWPQGQSCIEWCCQSSIIPSDIRLLSISLHKSVHYTALMGYYFSAAHFFFSLVVATMTSLHGCRHVLHGRIIWFWSNNSRRMHAFNCSLLHWHRFSHVDRALLLSRIIFILICQNHLVPNETSVLLLCCCACCGAVKVPAVRICFSSSSIWEDDNNLMPDMSMGNTRAQGEEIFGPNCRFGVSVCWTVNGSDLQWATSYSWRLSIFDWIQCDHTD